MRFNKLDLNLLVALDALLTEQHISRAAEKIHLSQSAMSNALGRLRTYFDDDLLVPIGRKMELTPRAEILKDSVRDVLVRIEGTVAAQPAFVPTGSDRTFRIFASEYTQLVLAPHLMRLLAGQGPGLQVEWLPQGNNSYLQIERGEADFLIIPEAFCSQKHPTERLFEEDFVCLVWRESHLAQGQLTLQRYQNALHACMRPGDGRTQAYESLLFQSRGLTRKIAVTTYSFATLPSLITGTEYIATVHRRLARYFEKAWPVAMRPMPIPFGTMHQCVQWHQYRTQDPALIWLRSLLPQAVAAMDGPAAKMPAG